MLRLHLNLYSPGPSFSVRIQTPHPSSAAESRREETEHPLRLTSSIANVHWEHKGTLFGAMLRWRLEVFSREEHRKTGTTYSALSWLPVWSDGVPQTSSWRSSQYGSAGGCLGPSKKWGRWSGPLYLEPPSPFSAWAEHIISLQGLRSIELGCVMCLTRNLDGSRVIIYSICFFGSLSSPWFSRG